MPPRKFVTVALVLLVLAGATSVVVSSLSASGSAGHTMPNGQTMQNEDMDR